MITQFFRNKLPFNKYDYLALICGLLLLVSINSNSHHIIYFPTFYLSLNISSFFTIVNAARFLIPFIIFFIFIYFFLVNYKFLTKKKPISKLFLLLIVNFFYQLMIYIKNVIIFDIGYVQLAMGAISFAMLYIFSTAYNLKYFPKIFFKITIIFLFLITLFYCYKIFFSTILNHHIYLYSSDNISPVGRSFGQPNPRVTGLSKILVVYFVFHFFTFYNIKQKNKFFDYFNYIILFIIVFLAYGFQTRGAVVGFAIFLVIYLFFVNEKFFKKLIKIILIMLVPLIFYEISMKYIINKIKIGKNFNHMQIYTGQYNDDIETSKFLGENNRILNKNQIMLNDSGRNILWKLGIKLINEKKIILGVGPQGDRQIFEKYKSLRGASKYSQVIRWSTNISNGILYSYLSGGIVSVLIIFIIYGIIIREVFISVFKNQVFKKNSNINIVSIFCLIFMCFRTIFENGFTLFGTDYILTIIAFYNLYNFNNYSKIKSFHE